MAGIVMVALGIGAVLEGLRHSIGTVTHMGTGYFPVVLGSLLAAVGVLIAIGAVISVAEADAHDLPILPPDWRGCGAIVLGVVVFIVLGTQFGLAPATFVSAFIAALGDRGSTLKAALALSLLLTLVAVVGFWYILQVQFPVLQWPS